MRQSVAALFDRSRGFDDTILTNASGPYAGVADETFAEAGVQSFNRQIESYLAGDGVEITPLLAAVAADPDDRVHRPARRRPPTCSPPRRTASRTRPIARQRLFMGIAVGGLVLALLVTWFASRSITRPLRSLKRQAEDMADSRLPAAVRQILDTPPARTW